ncbi:MAG: flagellar biosynthesis anti-sigma factor FlgM [Sulfuritalea sp.]|nr:flagellar biosynthesis anti-sigma factor FlgM [Sulfuritalea sp.]
MKIDNTAKTIGSGQSPAGSRAAGSKPATAHAATASPSAGQPATVVSVAMQSVGGSEPAFNAEKVAEIRQAISEGRFQVNSERIADGLISSVREMLDQNRRPA